jgi:hypothetical protein
MQDVDFHAAPGGAVQGIDLAPAPEGHRRLAMPRPVPGWWRCACLSVRKDVYQGERDCPT